MKVERADFESPSGSEAWLKWRARGTPDAIALVYAGREISYSELDQRARERERVLAAKGLQAGDVVALLMPNGLDFVELIHAAWYRGLVLTLLNTRLSVLELEFQLRDCNAAMLIYGEGELALKAEEVLRRIPSLADFSSQPLPCAEEDAGSRVPRARGEGARSEGPLVILYTSGTSGRPKGVMLSAANFLYSAQAAAELLGGAAQARWLLCLPLFHVGGLSILFRSVLAGTTVILHDRFDPDAVSRALDRDAVTGISLVPNMLARVLAERVGQPPPASLVFVLLGGGPAPSRLFEAAQEAGIAIAPTYGLTEAASQVATRPPSSTINPRDAGLVPLPGTVIKIVDDLGRELPDGEEGEILVRSASVMQGYWGREEQSDEALVDGWLHTGDVGALSGDGSLQVFDRRRDLIVSGGENVYPAEVESALLEHPCVAEAGVAGVSDARFGSRPVAWLVARDGTELSSEAILSFCGSRLARYKIPLRVHWVESLPRTASGKLLRRHLQEP